MQSDQVQPAVLGFLPVNKEEEQEEEEEEEVNKEVPRVLSDQLSVEMTEPQHILRSIHYLLLK